MEVDKSFQKDAKDNRIPQVSILKNATLVHLLNPLYCKDIMDMEARDAHMQMIAQWQDFTKVLSDGVTALCAPYSTQPVSAPAI